MKLGTQTNSLTNHLLARGVVGQPEPEVGMGATVLCWTDRNPATIVAVRTLRGHLYIDVQEDKAERTDNNGLSEEQHYSYEPNPRGYVNTYRREKNGMWAAVTFNTTTQRWNKTDGHGLRIGSREKYRDFSF